VIVGDFNGDGIQDLAVADYGSDAQRATTISVLLGNGDGTFSAAQPFEAGNGASGVAVGDFNRDGVQDLVVSHANDNTVSVLVGNGDGTFQAARSFGVGAFPWFVVVGDFNADQTQDLAVSDQMDDAISVLLGNGDGSFEAALTFPTGRSPAGVAVGDFNADGTQDLAVVNAFATTVSVLVGKGDGTFLAAEDFGVGNAPASVAVGDFNGDGMPDLGVANYSVPYSSSSVSVLINPRVASPPRAASPTFSPPAGTYVESTSVTLSVATSGATIHYTTDGTAPTSSSPVYTDPIVITCTTTIRAMAAASGMIDSDEVAATYTIQAAAPTFSLADGTYNQPQSVALSTTTGGATMYYTTDGSTPTPASTVYTGPIAVTQTMTIQAMAAASGMLDSSVSSATFTLQAAMPSFSPPGGSYLIPQQVSLADASPGTTIYYTTNGSTPTIASTQYTGPISVVRTTTIRAIAVAAGWSQSPVADATYTIAGDPGWFWQNPLPQGNPLSATAMVDANTIYAVGGHGSVLRSSDGGVHWTIQTTGTRAELHDVSCPDANTCTAVGESGTIVRTTNGGGNWTMQTAGTSGFLHAVSCTDANTCTAVGAGTILRTTDGGVTWTPQSSPTQYINDVSCTDASTCTAVGSWGKIVRTTDAGVTWSIQSSGTPTDRYGVSYTHLSAVSCPEANTCTAVGNQVGNPGWILRTTDGGTTWITQSSGFDNASEELYDIFCSDANTCTATGYSVIVRTTDGGATWTRQQVSDTNNLFVGLNIPLLGVSCSDANTCTAVGAAIVRTTDGGVNWSVQTPTSAVTFQYLKGVSCADANTCTAVGNNGTIVRTADGGATWAAQSSGTAAHLNGVSCSDANTCTAVGNFRPVDGGAGMILRTTNRGATWIQQASGTISRFAGVSCPDANTCTAVGGVDDVTSPWGTRATILRTNDGGATWTPQSPSQNPNDPVPELFGVSFIDANTGTAVGARSTILRTYQGGEDWSPQQPNTPRTVRSVSMTDVDTGMAAADGNILRASPPGEPWTPVSGDTAFGISCTDANTCTAVGAGDILRTTDGGASWIRQPNPSQATLFSVSCTAADRCTAVGGQGTILGWGNR
jgi:photosystem II stability/assembly factor-like uncharacterized protein